MSSEFMKESAKEMDWKKITEDALIEAYVPEAEILTRGEALKLALIRDELAAKSLIESTKSSVRLDNVRVPVTDASRNNSAYVNKLIAEMCP